MHLSNETRAPSSEASGSSSIPGAAVRSRMRELEEKLHNSMYADQGGVLGPSKPGDAQEDESHATGVTSALSTPSSSLATPPGSFKSPRVKNGPDPGTSSSSSLDVSTSSKIPPLMSPEQAKARKKGSLSGSGRSERSKSRKKAAAAAAAAASSLSPVPTADEWHPTDHSMRRKKSLDNSSLLEESAPASIALTAPKPSSRKSFDSASSVKEATLAAEFTSLVVTPDHSQRSRKVSFDSSASLNDNSTRTEVTSLAAPPEQSKKSRTKSFDSASSNGSAPAEVTSLIAPEQFKTIQEAPDTVVSVPGAFSSLEPANQTKVRRPRPETTGLLAVSTPGAFASLEAPDQLKTRKEARAPAAASMPISTSAALGSGKKGRKKNHSERVVVDTTGIDVADAQSRWEHYASEGNDDDDFTLNTWNSTPSAFSTPCMPSNSVEPLFGTFDSGSNGLRFGQRDPLEPIQEQRNLPGAYSEASVPIQNLLATKYSVRPPTDPSRTPQSLSSLLERKLHAYQPSDACSVSEATSGESSAVTVNVSNLTAPPPPPPVRRSDSSRYSLLSRQQSRRDPRSQVLDSQTLDSQGRALSEDELKEIWKSAGMCTECGRTQTHAKIKFGPFKAFRRMEPITTDGYVYKGYCLLCYEVEDLQRLLKEPNLKAQDVPRAADAAMLTSIRDQTNFGEPRPNKDPIQMMCSNWKFQLCLASSLLIAFGAGISLAIVLSNQGEKYVPPPPTLAPTQSPTPEFVLWAQVGADIQGNTTSFGRAVSLSKNGTRLAVSSPGAGAGLVNTYKHTLLSNGTDVWDTLGGPISGDASGDLAGMGMSLAWNGTIMAVGYPGNGNGYVRIFEYADDQSSWIQLGQTIVGTSEGSRFGESVKLNPNGTIVVIGAPQDSNQTGLAQVYLYNGTAWGQLGQNLVGAAEYDSFGSSVSVDDTGGVVLVGAPGNDEDWLDAGQIHIYFLDFTTLQWQERLNSRIYGSGNNAKLGSSCALSGDGHGVVASSSGADGDLQGFSIDDQAYESDTIGGDFPKVQGTNGLGYSIDFSDEGDRLIASAFNTGDTSGKVVVYDLSLTVLWELSGEPFGGLPLGDSAWLGQGPAVAISTDASSIAIGYESVMVDGQSIPIVQVFSYKGSIISGGYTFR